MAVNESGQRFIKLSSVYNTGYNTISNHIVGRLGEDSPIQHNFFLDNKGYSSFELKDYKAYLMGTTASGSKIALDSSDIKYSTQGSTFKITFPKAIYSVKGTYQNLYMQFEHNTNKSIITTENIGLTIIDGMNFNAKDTQNAISGFNEIIAQAIKDVNAELEKRYSQTIVELDKNVANTLNKVDTDVTKKMNEVDVTVSNKMTEIDTKSTAKFNKLDKQISDMDGKLLDVDSKVNSKMNVVDATVSKKMSDVDTTVAKKMSDVDKKITVVDGQISEMDTKLKKVDTDVTKKMNEVDTTFGNKMTEIDTQSKSKLNKLDKQISDMDVKLVGVDTKVDNKLNEVDEKLATSNALISEIEGKLSNVDDDLIAIESKVDGKLEEYSEKIDSEVGKLDGKLSESDVKIDTLQKEVEDFQKNIDNMVEHLQDLITEAIEPTLEDLKVKLKEYYDTLSTQLTTDVEKLKGNISTLEESMGSMNTNIDGMLTRLGDAETRMTAIEESLGGIDISKVISNYPTTEYLLVATDNDVSKITESGLFFAVRNSVVNTPQGHLDWYIQTMYSSDGNGFQVAYGGQLSNEKDVYTRVSIDGYWRSWNKVGGDTAPKNPPGYPSGNLERKIISDFNNATMFSGTYYIPEGTRNYPENCKDGYYLTNKASSGGRCSQIVELVSPPTSGSNMIFHRTLSSGTWTPWKPLD